MLYKVTVIVPVYNAAPFLTKCLNSIINQTYSNLEIILVNDGSTDSSPVSVDEYAKKDERIIALHKENGGIGSAYKKAFEILSGEYVLFVDSDDWLELNAVEKLIGLAEKNKADMVSFGVRAFNANGENVTLKSLKNIDLINNTKEDILKTHFEVLKHPTLARLYKRKLFNNIVVFEQNIGIDEMLTPQLLVKCNKVVYTSDIYYNILVRKDSVSRAVYTDKKIRQSIEVNRFVCSFMEKNIPQYVIFSQIKYLNTLHFIYNEALRNKELISDDIKTEILVDIKELYPKVKFSVTFMSEIKKIKLSLFLIFYFPSLHRVYIHISKK